MNALFNLFEDCIMAVFRLYFFVALIFLALSVNDSVSTTPVTAKSETKPLKGALLTNLTSLTTRPTTDRSSQPVITTEFKRGQYNNIRRLSVVLYFYLAMLIEFASIHNY